MSMVINPYAFAGAAGHAYWRVFCADNHGDATGIVLAEVEMRATPAGADQCSGGTAIGSDDAAANTFAQAFDNSAASRWFADSGPTNQWIGYHFAGPVDVQEVLITLADGGTNALTRHPKNCSVDWSDDGSSWTTAFSFVNNAPLLGGQRVFPESSPAAGYHRYWRVFCLNNNGGTNFIILDEVEFRATAGGADQTTTLTTDAGDANGRAVASGGPGGNEMFRAFDGVTTSANPWAGPGTTNQYIGYVFPSPVKVEEISLKGTTQTTRMPKDIQVEYSDDGSSWTNQKSISTLSWTSNETKVLTAI
jgi:hypothetical protein